MIVALFWLGLGALIGLDAAKKRNLGTAQGLIGGALLGPLLAWLLYFAKG